MLEFLTIARWSPYIAGAGIGIVSCLAFVFADRPLGCSTAFVKARGLIGKMISAEKTMAMEYYQDIVPKVDWPFMIIPGIIIGAFFSSFLSGTFHFLWVPALWASVFGNNVVLRVVVALAGGILLGFGARCARHWANVQRVRADIGGQLPSLACRAAQVSEQASCRFRRRS